jgi:hypothetical protein
MTDVSTAGWKKKACLKPEEQVDAFARKQELNASAAGAIEAIDRIIEALACEHEITFETSLTLVRHHVGGRVLCDRRRPSSIQNAYRVCLARVEEDGRC